MEPILLQIGDHNIFESKFQLSIEHMFVIITYINMKGLLKNERRICERKKNWYSM